MGANLSVDPAAIKKKSLDFDLKHEATFKKIDSVLRHELACISTERHTMEHKLDALLQKHSAHDESRCQGLLRDMLSTARDSQSQEGAMFKQLFDAWGDIIRNNSMEVSEHHVNEIMRRMELVRDKEKQSCDFLYEKEVIAPLEALYNSERMDRNLALKELLLKISRCVQAMKHRACAKHTASVFRLGDELYLKDREYCIKRDGAVQAQLEQLLGKTVVKDEDLAKQKTDLNAAIQLDKQGKDKNYLAYQDSLAVIMREDKDAMEALYQQCVVNVSKLVSEFKTAMGRRDANLPQRAHGMLRNGWQDVILVHNKAAKNTIVELIRKDADLVQHRKDELLATLQQFRSAHKERQQIPAAARREAALQKLRKTFLEDGPHILDALAKALNAGVEELLVEDKVSVDNMRASVAAQLVALLKHDQGTNDSMITEMNAKIEKLHSQASLGQGILDLGGSSSSGSA